MFGSHGGRTERGSIVPLMAAVVLLGSLFTVGVTNLGSGLVASARADSVADVSALAAAVAGRAGAEAVAGANDARLTGHGVRPDGSYWVEVQLDSVKARAAAVAGN